MVSSEISLLAKRIRDCDRRALARAVTLVESTRPDHQDQARALLALLRSPTFESSTQSLRVGLTGTPGVGKSTFIEALGLHLCDAGHRVAVLAVDPSSQRSGGAILGDKTRMPDLSRRKDAFIRPSPSRDTLGGVAANTRAVIELCEAAGFDIVLVETVGVGQSETAVAELTDIFALLIAPGGGDELQGVKRGIMELADLVLVNKADGETLNVAIRTASDYAGALRLLRRPTHTPEGFPKALTISATMGNGLSDAWTAVQTLADWRKAQGVLDARRIAQASAAFERALDAKLLAALKNAPDARKLISTARAQVREQQESPDAAAQAVLDTLHSHKIRL